ncbi:MAG: hypothetical protein A2X61_10895 [Ignavibacteria bacterium GWB2_35_12]|nr:MAG: hypothetical protein A2X63_05110 [Ignavibacteria bacterium GWA2_35_8]OGU40317.1 MAG: hypothetical protein A2X61_10895 [Ignavibacteria bacterium GWB2_35_12]OGU93053.1 MAG: hypothetical protein A2220_16015 [Ignavibacteria bacterium RIFOXYA2_FULL_35_10]OGV24745.1 MAG: hypothetical protein A2475_14120 [Ignavibacteria bacterium RIFOXYC2_FULL_35_21]
MSKRIVLIYIIVVLSYLQVYSAGLFSKPEIGISGAYGLSFQVANFQNLPGVSSCCPNYSGGSGTAFSFGPLLKFNISQDAFIDTRLLYYYYSGLMNESESINLIIDGESQEGIFDYNLKSDIHIISLEPTAGYKITNNFNASAGLSLGFLISGKYDSYEQLVKPENRGTFNNGRRTRNDTSGKIPDVNSFQAGIKLGLAYKFPLDSYSDWYLSPEINYIFHFTNIATDINWKTNSLTLGVSIAGKMFSETKPMSIPPSPPPLPVLPEFPAPQKTDVDITAIKLDSNNNELSLLYLKLEDIVTLNMRPLLNYIFFDKVSSEIPERYIKLTTEQARDFNLKSIHDLDAMQTYYQILNLVGKKLYDNPDYHIKLIGTNSGIGREKDNKELSLARAEAVKTYFTDIWKIPEEQLGVEARNLPEDYSTPKEYDAWEENRRVEILPSNKSILEPILTLDTIPNPEKVKFRFYPIVTNPSEIEKWKIEISTGNNLIETIEGKGQIPNSVEWTPTEKDFLNIEAVNEIMYRLTVNDNDGDSIQSRLKKIPLEKVTIEKKRQEGLVGKNVEYYRLILFNFGKTNLLEEHSNIIDYIKRRINPDAKVTVTGYTDKIGNFATNKQIATKRAKEAAKLLGIEDADIIGIGEESLLYDNSLPEGRFYCRTVNITLEMPIK